MKQYQNWFERFSIMIFLDLLLQIKNISGCFIYDERLTDVLRMVIIFSSSFQTSSNDRPEEEVETVCAVWKRCTMRQQWTFTILALTVSKVLSNICTSIELDNQQTPLEIFLKYLLCFHFVWGTWFSQNIDHIPVNKYWQGLWRVCFGYCFFRNMCARNP